MHTLGACLYFIGNFVLHSQAKPEVLENYLTKQTHLWCYASPNGFLYTRGHSVECVSKRIQYKNAKLRNVKLRVGVLANNNDYDFDCLVNLQGNEVNVKDSYSAYLFRLLQRELEFKAEFVPSNTWGRPAGRRNWTGLVGLLARGEIDLAMTHSSVTRRRAAVTDFLLSTLHSTRALIFRTDSLPLTRDVFMRTFSRTLWLCFATALLLLSLSFKFSTWLHSRVRPDHEPWSWVEVLLWTDAAVCQQSYNRHPKGSSCRTMFLIGYLITYLLYTGFAAGVTSLLAVQGQYSKLSFMDVIVMKLKLVVQSDSTHFQYLKDSPDQYARSIYEHLMGMLLDNRVRNLNRMFQRLEMDNVVGLGSSVTLTNYLRRKVCPNRAADYMMSTIPNSDQQKSFLIRKNFRYKEIFNFWLLRLKESGLQDVGKRRFIHIPELSCCEPPGWSSAGIGNVLSSVIILCGGWFLSVLILLMELAWWRRTASRAWELYSKEEVLMRIKNNKIQKYGKPLKKRSKEEAKN